MLLRIVRRSFEADQLIRGHDANAKVPSPATVPVRKKRLRLIPSLFECIEVSSFKFDEWLLQPLTRISGSSFRRLRFSRPVWLSRSRFSQHRRFLRVCTTAPMPRPPSKFGSPAVKALHASSGHRFSAPHPSAYRPQGSCTPPAP